MREETQAEKVKRWRVTVEASCYMPALGTEVSRIQSLPSRALVQLILLRTAGPRCTTEGRKMWSRYSMSPRTPNSTTPSCEPHRLHSAHAPHVCSSLWLNGVIVAAGTQEGNLGTSLVVQWLRLHSPSAGVQLPSLVREQRSSMPQLRGYMLQLRPGAAKQINK